MSGMSPLDMPPEEAKIPFSILDTDFYKLTMQHAVLKLMPEGNVVIRFNNRSPQMTFSQKTFSWIQDHVNRLASLRLTPSERDALHKTCPYFPDSYLDYLSNIHLDPENQVNMTFHPVDGSDKGEIQIEIRGPWRDCILYEVPVMSILSEGYFKFDDTDWNMDGQREKAKEKALQLLNPPKPTEPLLFSEFGTRRRRSFHAQDLVLRGLIDGQKEWEAGRSGSVGGLAGTSNVYFALKYRLKPAGTIAHEWIMAIGALYGYKGANGRAMDMWEQAWSNTNGKPPLTMLTDTYTAQAFFVDFKADPARAMRWTTLRQDSGDPVKFIRGAMGVWKEIEDAAGVKRASDHEVGKGKRIIFSDGLNVQKAIELQQLCDELGMGASFGIGTSFTNDFEKASQPGEKSHALNIVIKLNQIDGKDCVKLSDDKGKHTGSLAEVRKVQQELGLPE